MRKKQDEPTGRAVLQPLLLNIPEVAASLRLTWAKVYQLINCQILNPLKGDKLASRLHRNSVSHEGEAALASPSDASGHLTSAPSLLSMPNKERYQSTKNVFPRHGVLAWNPPRSAVPPAWGVGKEPVGKPSLSGFMKRSFIVPGVPKPTPTYSNTTVENRKPNG